MKRFLQFLRINFVRAAFITILPLLYVLDIFVRVRFGTLYSARIGHLAGNTEWFFRRLAIDGWPSRTVYFLCGWDPANKQLLAMMRRVYPVYESRILTALLFYVRPIAERTRFWLSLKWSDTDYREFNLARTKMSFTEEEEAFGRAELRRLGVPDGDWFVCLHARDSAYLHAWRPQDSALWGTRDFRNSAIESYLDAADYITSKGGWVIRMGAVVEKPIETDNPRIIDYATRFRTDFMDIWLCARARFFLGTNSGLFVVSMIFDRPCALANMQPLGLAAFRSGDLFIPKPQRDAKTGELAPFWRAREAGMYDHGKMFRKEMHEDAGLTWGENTPEDILKLTAEMFGRLENHVPSKEDIELQEYYKRHYLYGDHLDKSGNICPQFVRKYYNLIQLPTDIRSGPVS